MQVVPRRRGSLSALLADRGLFGALDRDNRLLPLPTVAAARLGADFLSDVLAGCLVNHTHRQLHLAALTEADDLDLHRVPNIHHVGGFADPALLQLADM